ncbi:MAG: TIR domain-containing protein [Oscillospiraceae bacterium]|nr:TIR domain-containing protein [Oscillospiraceae bacterium]
MSVELTDEEFTGILREKAIAGDPAFQYRVGSCYLWGNGIDKNYEEAAKWIKLAAEDGYAPAQHIYGRLFYKGTGVEQDYQNAITWFKLSEQQEYAPAENDLAVCYKNGDGVTQNHNEAIRLFINSDKHGYWRASYNLGRMFRDGQSVEQDLIKAKQYFEKALDNSDFLAAPAGENGKRLIKNKIDEINALLKEAEEKAATARKAERTEVFISYAHKDAEIRDELKPHLKTLERTTAIKWWDDTQIKPGDNWNEKIKGALAKAKIAILFVSANFFESDYVWREELPDILAAADKDGATILWLPVSYCDYDETGIEKYQAVTDPKNPLRALSTVAERDKVYTELSKRIKSLFKTPAEQ